METKLNTKRVEGLPVTICIGAICEAGKDPKVIVASDRMITAGHLAIQFEHDVPKLETIHPTCVALTAGSIVHTGIFDEAKKKIQELKEPTISQIAEIVKNQYIREKKKRAEDSLLGHRGMKIADVYSGKIPIELLVRLDSEIDAIRIELEALVCGVDKEGGHIYHIRDVPTGMRMGLLDCYDLLGYMAIGSGAPHAATTFITFKYVPTMPSNKAIHIVYEAKKASEVAPGVGKEVDIAVIDKKGIHKLSQNTMDQLKNIYNKRRELLAIPQEEIEKLVKCLAIQFKDE